MFGGRISLPGFAMLALACAPASARDLSPEGYFTGKTSAVGRFRAINGVKRDVTVDLRGPWNGRTLTLVEDFVYSPG